MTSTPSPIAPPEGYGGGKGDDIEALEEQLTKLYVSDLPPSVTSDDLRQVFEKFGPMDEVVVKHGDGQAGAHFGFVWTTPSAATKIMSRAHTVGEFVIPAPVLARRQRRHGKDIKAAGLQDPRITPDKIFVGGLSNETTVEDYRAYFAEYGAVKDAIIMHDRLTNRSRGFGFILFEDPAAAAAVLAAPVHELDGRKVEVKPAMPKDMMRDDELGADGPSPPLGGRQRRKGLAGHAPPDGAVFYGDDGYPAAYPQEVMMTMMPGGMPVGGPPGPYYYAYGVAAPMQAAPMRGPGMAPYMMPMPLPSRGVPVPSSRGGDQVAHSFVHLPPPMPYYDPGMAPPMAPMYPMMHGVPVSRPNSMHVYAPPMLHPHMPPPDDGNNYYRG